MVVFATTWNANRIFCPAKGVRSIRIDWKPPVESGMLADVPFVNSGGVSELVQLVAAANTRGGRVVLASLSPFFERVLQTTQLDRFFTVGAKGVFQQNRPKRPFKVRDYGCFFSIRNRTWEMPSGENSPRNAQGVPIAP